MRDQHRLRRAEVRERRHQRVAGRCRLRGQRGDDARDGALQQRDAAAQVQPQVERHLLVARSAGVQPAARRRRAARPAAARRSCGRPRRGRRRTPGRSGRDRGASAAPLRSGAPRRARARRRCASARAHARLPVTSSSKSRRSKRNEAPNSKAAASGAVSNATNLWSGRFDAAPDAAAFDFGASFRFDRRLFEDDVTGSLAWARALSRAGVLAHDEAAQIDAALADPRARPIRSGVRQRRRRGRPQLRRADARRAARRRRTSSAHRPIANEQVSLDLRLYLRRRIPLLQRASPRWSARSPAGRIGGRRAHAVLHALASGAAGARCALLSRAVGGAAARLRAAGAARATKPMRCRLAPARLPGTSYADRRATRSRATWGSRASSPTASTPRRIAISPRRSCTRAR